MGSAPMQGSLSTYLMQRLERDLNLDAGGCRPSEGSADLAARGDGDKPADAKRARHTEVDAGNSEEEDDDLDGLISEDEDGDREGGSLPGAEHRDDDALRRARFLKAMRDRFVNGAEPG